MVKRDIFPAVSGYAARVAGAINAKRAAMPDIDCGCEERLLRKLTALTSEMMAITERLETAVYKKVSGTACEVAHYFKDNVFDTMVELRAVVDQLEVITASDCWPYPSYTDMLFSIK